VPNGLELTVSIFIRKAISGYDTRITKAIDQFLLVIEDHNGRTMDVATWFDYFVFDIMEDLAFNRSSNMLVEGKEDYALQTIRRDMYYLALVTHIPWLMTLLKRIPLLNANYLKFWDWIQHHLDQRIQVLDINFQLD